MKKITKVKSKYIVGNLDGKNVLYKDAEMLISDGQVLSVGHNLECEECELRDYGNAIISPGFVDVNGVGDIDHAMLDSEQRFPQKLIWSKDYFENRRHEPMSEEEEAFKSLFAYCQLLSRGITTAMPITSVYYKEKGETYEEIVAAKKHAERIGIRLYLGQSYVSGQHIYDFEKKEQSVGWMPEAGLAGLKTAKKFALENLGGGLVNAVMVPERIELQTEDVLLKTKKFANDNNLIVRLHAAQSDFEYDEIFKKYNMSPIKYLDSIGFLDDKTIIPHVLFTSGYSRLADKSDDDLDILAERGVSVVHCPKVYPRFGASLESFGRLVRHGINICLGTDTYPPNLFEAMRIGHAVGMSNDKGAKENHHNYFYEAATLSGAKALHRPDLGKLCAGSAADYFVVSLDDFDIGVIDDPMKNLCMNANPSNIIEVVVDGQVRVKRGQVLGVDYAELKAKAQKYYDKMKASFIERSDYNGKPFFDNMYEIK